MEEGGGSGGRLIRLLYRNTEHLLHKGSHVRSRSEHARMPRDATHGEAVAGISVSGPSGRIEEGDVDRLAEAVKAAATKLSAALGAG